MNCFKSLFLGCFFSFTAATGYADSIYEVTNVYDGDTVELSVNNTKFKLRLMNIDAPERNQAYWKKSRLALSKLCKGSHILVTAEIFDIDKYQRSLGKLYCNQIDVNVYLVEKGLAWHNAKYSTDPTTQNAEHEARQQRLGLWKSKKPIPPWVWRQKYRY